VFSLPAGLLTLLGMSLLILAYLHEAPWGPVQNGLAISPAMGLAAVMTCLVAAGVVGAAWALR